MVLNGVGRDFELVLFIGIGGLVVIVIEGVNLKLSRC